MRAESKSPFLADSAKDLVCSRADRTDPCRMRCTVRDSGVDLCLLVRAHLDRLSEFDYGENSVAPTSAPTMFFLQAVKYFPGCRVTVVVDRGFRGPSFHARRQCGACLPARISNSLRTVPLFVGKFTTPEEHALRRDLAAGIIGDGHGQGASLVPTGRRRGLLATTCTQTQC